MESALTIVINLVASMRLAINCGKHTEQKENSSGSRRASIRVLAELQISDNLLSCPFHEFKRDADDKRDRAGENHG